MQQLHANKDKENIHRPLKRHSLILGAVSGAQAVWPAIDEKK